MDTIVTPGLVLKETRYKESDRILTILTPELGVISASAQSSLRLKNKLFSACGLFCYSEFVLLPGRNMYTIREAEVRNVFHGISSTIEGMSLAMYLAEMAAALSPTGEEAAKELRLLLNCLYMISEGKTDLHVVKAVFELRTMSECGFLPQLPDGSLESRHLGLVTAAEVENLKEKIQRLGAAARESIDLDALLEIAKSAPPLTFAPPDIPEAGEHVRIGVARDKAFCFYYEDSLDLLRRLGAELVPFSPLSDEQLPEGVHGLYLGGGYPELYADKLEKNAPMRKAVCAAVEAGMPCIAECGGFMYLTSGIAGRTMTGVFPGGCFDAGKLTRFGYLTLTAQRDSMLFDTGEKIPAHEFHRWDAEQPGNDFLAEKISGRSWRCAYAGETLYAGYPHFHFYADIGAAERFVAACRKEKHRHERTDEANGN